MSGSRSVSGCWTCRIRRKKCDEGKPYCSSCTSRAIPCLGYSRQRPEWMQQAGASWQQILESGPAQALRRMAQQSYNDSRRRAEDDTDTNTQRPREIAWRLNQDRFLPIPQLQELDRIWWGSNMLAHIPFHSPEAQNLLNYLEVIFNLQFGWYFPQAINGTHQSPPHRSWLYQALQANEPLYDISVSLGLSLEARRRADENSSGSRLAANRSHRLYGRALRSLQPMIDDIASRPGDSSADCILKKVRALAAVMHLITFEVFNHVSGSWLTHLDASGRILGMLQNQMWDNHGRLADSVTGLIQQPVCSEQGFLLRLYATSFAWLDLVSQSTFGPQMGRDGMFYNYVPLLRRGYLDTREVMGVATRVWLAVGEVVSLELDIMTGGQGSYSLQAAVFAIDERLHTVIAEERGKEVQDDSSVITIIFALGALVYLHTVTLTGSADDALVMMNAVECLEELEKLPTRLLVRITWPLTLAGCMAKGQDKHSRFRDIVARAEAGHQTLGFLWKGLLIMEMCWRLREEREGVWTWRNASEALGERVLLI